MVRIYVTTRASKNDPWEQPVNLGWPINTGMSEFEPDILNDELTLFFNCRWAGTVGDWDVWMTTRPSTNDLWPQPTNLGPTVNSSAGDGGPSITADGLMLFFDSARSGGSGDWDVWMTTRPYIGADWGTPVNLGPAVNSSPLDGCTDISSDGRILFFFSSRPGGAGDVDIWMTRRPTIEDPWEPAVNLGPMVNTSAYEGRPKISADGRLLLFESNRSGGMGSADIWQAPIIPIVDFNGDGIVDLKDFSRLAQYWRQNESSVDMGPTPLGDGTVDIQDVAVLAEYWLSEGPPIGLIAHWKLDETEGGRAHESIKGKDGLGPPGLLWCLEGGKVGGALQLDGVDDFLFTPFILDPSAGAFSVFTRIKGGGPEQAIISQAGGVNWLAAGTSQGKLMTELKASGRYGTPLFSEEVIIDGEWHLVGLSWDGSNRKLFVDNVEVAKGTQASPAASQGGLYIGAGKNLELGSFWSGLIDDVKVYDRALTP